MNKIILFVLILFSSACVFAIEWNGRAGFSDWTSPRNCTLSSEGGIMKLTVTGRDSHIVNNSVKIDPKLYSQVEIEYRATGIPEENNGQIYFATAGQGFQGGQNWAFGGLRNDGQWRKKIISNVIGGMERWRNCAMIDKLRLDMIDQDTGVIEIRSIKFTNPGVLDGIVPANEDIGNGSSAHLQLWSVGRPQKGLLIIGKGNKFDHRYRVLLRFPLDTLLAAGKANEAVLEFRLNLFLGSEKQRTYIIDVLNEDIQKMKANDLNSTNIIHAGKIVMDKSNIDEPVQINLTDAVNHALSEVWSAVTVRIRPEIEKNDDPGASGAAINPNSIHLITR